MNIRFDKLQKLADFLRTLEDEQFYFGSVVADADEDGCGTVCCAMGWAPAVFPKETHWHCGELYWNKSSNIMMCYDDIAAGLFNAPLCEMNALFSPNQQRDIDGWGQYPVCDDDAAPHEMADAIEYYIEIRRSTHE